ncbi:MAG: phage tail family protein [Clostridia bacterium]|nr:phage tail family protein [Clostridia bacterium]
MEIIFKNSYGKILMSGKNILNAWKIREISGLGLPEKSYSYNTFAGVPGQELSQAQVLPRTITIAVDIERNCLSEISRAARVLLHDGDLIICHKTKQRKIFVRCISFTKQERNDAINRAVVQFVADNPYFTDCEAKCDTVAMRTKNLTSDFTLPKKFSERKSKNILVVSGDSPSEPEIFISCLSDGFAVGQENYVEIINHTTKKSIRLDYELSYGEEIVIDVLNRKITSSTGKNMYAFLSKDSFLSDFYLDVGANEIECVCPFEVTVNAKYKNNYAEAMY